MSGSRSSGTRSAPRAASSGMSSVMRYWCESVTMGRYAPTIAATSPPRYPAALMTFGVWITPLSVVMRHSPEGVRSMAVTRVWR